VSNEFVVGYSDGLIEIFSLIISPNGTVIFKELSKVLSEDQITALEAKNSNILAATKSGNLIHFSFTENLTNLLSHSKINLDPEKNQRNIIRNYFTEIVFLTTDVFLVGSNSEVHLCSVAQNHILHTFYVHETPLEFLLSDSHFVVSFSRGSLKFWEFHQNQSNIAISMMMKPNKE